MKQCPKCNGRNFTKITHGDCLTCWSNNNETGSKKAFNKLVKIVKWQVTDSHIEKIKLYLEVNSYDSAVLAGGSYLKKIALGAFCDHYEELFNENKSTKHLEKLAKIFARKNLETNIAAQAVREIIEEKGLKQ